MSGKCRKMRIGEWKDEMEWNGRQQVTEGDTMQVDTAHQDGNRLEIQTPMTLTSNKLMHTKTLTN